MKFDEFKDQALDNLIKNHNLSEQQVDEVLPAIGMIAKGAAVGAKSAVATAAKAGAVAAKKVGASAVAGAQGAGKGLAAKIANKNAKTLQKSILVYMLRF